VQQKLMDRYLDNPIKWAAIVGFALAVIGTFFDWWKVDVGIIEVSESGLGETEGLLTFILGLIALGAIAVFAFTDMNIESRMLHWGLLAIAVLIDLLVLIQFIDILTTDGVDVGIGLWISILGAILATVGTVVPMWGEIQTRAQGMRR
jgi:hypothetical protein